MTSPSASKKRRNWILAGEIRLLLMASPMASAWGPEIRRMPIPPVPGGVAIAAMVSCAGMLLMLTPGRYYLAAASIRLVMTHCCAIDNTLLITQYKTSPDGKKAKKKVNTNGNAIMTLA